MLNKKTSESENFRSFEMLQVRRLTKSKKLESEEQDERKRKNFGIRKCPEFQNDTSMNLTKSKNLEKANESEYEKRIETA